MNRQTYYKNVKALLFNGKLPKQYYDGIERILNVWEERYPTEKLEKLAYILATAHHECRFNLAIEEVGKGRGKSYGRPGTNGKIFYGRGAAQLTWESNYKKMGTELGIDLFNKPELALVPDNSAIILVVGMMKGMFTGKKVGYTMRGGDINFMEERRVVNGTDRAALIASYANGHLAALRAATEPTVSKLFSVVEEPKGDNAVSEVTSKPMSESTTVWAEIGKITGVIGTLLTQVNGIERWAFISILCLVIIAGGWVIYERYKKAHVEGV